MPLSLSPGQRALFIVGLGLAMALASTLVVLDQPATPGTLGAYPIPHGLAILASSVAFLWAADRRSRQSPGTPPWRYAPFWAALAIAPGLSSMPLEGRRFIVQLILRPILALLFGFLITWLWAKFDRRVLGPE